MATPIGLILSHAPGSVKVHGQIISIEKHTIRFMTDDDEFKKKYRLKNPIVIFSMSDVRKYINLDIDIYVKISESTYVKDGELKAGKRITLCGIHVGE